MNTSIFRSCFSHLRIVLVFGVNNQYDIAILFNKNIRTDCAHFAF